MRKTSTVLKNLLFLLIAVPVMALASDASELPPLEAKPQQGLIEQLVATYASRMHYANRELNDELSSEVFERYLETLDPNKIYFTATDIASFEKQYRTGLDDALKGGNVEPAYEMYRKLRERLLERIATVDEFLEEEPDFTIDEEFLFDREDADWASSEAELDEYWRKRVKNEALGLILADKEWEEVSETLKNRYAGFRRRVLQVNSEDVFELFVNAYVHTLDPHTAYFSPRDSEEFEIRMSLKYEGIGASLQMEDEYVSVVRTLPGGSADKTKALKPKDRITAVGETQDEELTDVVGWRLDDVVDLIRGPKGSVVRLQVLPAGAAPGSEERVVELERSEIKLEEQAAQARVIEVPRGDRQAKMGVIEIPAFYLDYRAKMMGEDDFRSTTRDVRRLIDDLEEKGVEGLVIDLRNNGGGSLQEAAELTGLFIDEGPVVQVRSTGGHTEVIKDPNPGVAWDGPLVVMVNRFSASASEIFAGAMQDYGRGLVVGSQTFGKGTVQNLFDLNRLMNTETELGQLKMTIGKFYRVNGASTQHRGVQPDIVLPSEIDIDEFGESTQKTALPWDEISPARKVEEVRVRARDLLSELQAEVRERQADDELFQLYVNDVDEVRQQRARTRVSLNLEKRLEEREQENTSTLARLNQRRKALGLEPVADLEAAAEQEDEHDLLLHEAARILSDYLAELTPEQTGERLAAGGQR